MKKILLFILLAISSIAYADYTVIVPGPGGWTTIVLPELEKKLGEPINMEIIQGARDIPAGNKWAEKYRFDNKAIWFSNGGQAEAYLIEDVKFNFKDYEPILAQNLSIVVGYNKNHSPYNEMVKFAAGSGMNPDAMAITMMICGNLPKMADYMECYKKHINYVKGMKQPESALAYTREELNVIRQNPFDYNLQFAPLPFNQTWFSAGLLDIKTGKIMPDPNYPVGTRSFPEAFKAKWGVEPKGEFYDAWLLVKNYRDVLQKVLWVNKGNPNKDKLIKAAREMIADPEAQKRIAAKLGTYPWWVGDEVTQAQKALDKQLTMVALKNLIVWTNDAYGIQAIVKPDIVSKVK